MTAPEYLFRFYRDGKLVHAQRDTLRGAAFLVAESGTTADLVEDDKVLGTMDEDGVVSWSMGYEDQSGQVVVKLLRLAQKWRREAEKIRFDQLDPHNSVAKVLERIANDLMDEVRKLCGRQG